MQKFLTVLFFIFSISSFSQEYLNKNEKFDLSAFQYLDSLTIADKIPIEDYFKFSKPFSKWDIRPIKYEKVWSLDSIRTSSEISNSFWGGSSLHYEISIEEAGAKPNQFLKHAQIEKNTNINFFNQNINKFKVLASMVQKNKNLIFLNQVSLQRVDNVFKENNKYWTYLISQKSPFPISNKTKIEKNYEFTKEQDRILNLMKEINIYSVVKTDKGIFFLINGFTDNSYGFYYSPTKIMEKTNHLFEIMDFANINDEFFYYIAN